MDDRNRIYMLKECAVKIMDLIKDFVDRPLLFLSVGCFLVIFDLLNKFLVAHTLVMFVYLICFAVVFYKFLDYIRLKVISYNKDKSIEEKAKDLFLHLNKKEKDLLKIQLDADEHTFYVNYRDYVNFRHAGSSKGSYKDYNEVFALCSTLMQKGILTSQTANESTAFTIVPKSFGLLKKYYKEIFNNES